MPPIELKTLETGLHGRNRADFGTVRPRVQIPGPRPKSEYDDGFTAGAQGGAVSQPYHKLQPVYIEGRRTGRVAQRRVMMGTVTKAQVQRAIRVVLDKLQLSATVRPKPSRCASRRLAPPINSASLTGWRTGMLSR
jgi:hypothetical protein